MQESALYFSMPDLNKLSSYFFDLPPELIAQTPMEPRSASRLMVLHRQTGQIELKKFSDIASYLQAGDCLIFNNTKVLPARLYGKLATGGKIELLLTQPRSDKVWAALAKPASKLKVGTQIFFEGATATVLEILEGGQRLLEFAVENFSAWLDKAGSMPLPHYIRGGEADSRDKSWYQTVYAKETGAVAAPTAGLHFTQDILDSLPALGVDKAELTLHVGIGTFRPVQVEDVNEHVMHEERFSVGEAAASQINQAKRRIAVGTTSVRVLETLGQRAEKLVAASGSTDIFIRPGYTFKVTDAMLTNFHLPGSTLLMLVSAFCGYEMCMRAYEVAVRERFRFFSYGDALLIL